MDRRDQLVAISESHDVVSRECELTPRPRMPQLLGCVRPNVVPLSAGGLVETHHDRALHGFVAPGGDVRA